MKPPFRAALAAVLLPFLLVACGDDGGGDGDAGGGEVDSGQAANDGNDSGGDARVEDVDADDVIVEQTVGMPTNPDDEVTIGVHSLTVDGDVMVLRLFVTPDFSSVSRNEGISLFESMGRTNFRPKLVDTEHLKEYSIIENGNWATNQTTVETTNGEPMLAWAYYAAPEDDIDAIDVRVSDAWPSFLDVPITR